MMWTQGGALLHRAAELRVKTVERYCETFYYKCGAFCISPSNHIALYTLEGPCLTAPYQNEGGGGHMTELVPWSC